VLTKAATITVVTNILTINAFLQAQATARGWAFVDLNGLLASKASFIPKFPNLATPDTLFGVLFSLDGIHPTAAAHKAIADAFATAINGKYGTTLPLP
jgi:lysophospholipase L1-like esterase